MPGSVSALLQNSLFLSAATLVRGVSCILRAYHARRLPLDPKQRTELGDNWQSRLSTAVHEIDARHLPSVNASNRVFALPSPSSR